MARDNTKYVVIKDFIQNEILTRHLSQGDKLYTEKELCDKFGVSRATVQSAFSELQKAGKIYRIRGGGTYVGNYSEYIRESSPPPFKSDYHSDFIPFIISNNSPSSRSFEMITGAEDYLKNYSCYVTVHTAKGNFTTERDIITSLVDNGIKTMIILPFHSDINVQFYFELVQKQIKLVFIDLLPNGIVADLVSPNNVLGGYLITNHLIQNGYRRIAILSGEAKVAKSYTERISGYTFAHHKVGLPINSDMIISLKSSDDNTLRNEIPAAVDRLLSLPERPDAIFCLNDLIAFDTFNILQSRGIQIPDDIALTGFDNLSLSSKNTIPITTIDQNFHSIGYHAAKLCHESITSDYPGYTHLSLPVTLIERESSRPKHKK